MSKLDTPGSTDFLSTYSPFDSIDSELLNGVAGDIEVKVAEPGFCLFENGDYDPDEIYLMSGSISLIASDGRENIVNADHSHIRFPIARLRPRKYTAKASSEIRYFVINAAVLEEIQSSLAVDNVMLQEMQEQAGDDGRLLLYEFEQELNAGRFVLPSLPEVAFRIRELIDNPDCSMEELSRLVKTDPAIAAKLVKVANSAMYRGVSHCDDTLTAITRLGLVTTKQLVASFAILGLFRTKSDVYKEHMQRLWQQSVEVACYSYVLAKQLPGFNEEEAMLAGLIHSIGEIVLLTYAERFYDLSADENRLNQLITNLRGQLGAMVLSKWEFNEGLVTVARESHDWMRGVDDAPDDNSEFSYCDLVQVAMLYALHGDSSSVSLPEMSSVPAFNKLKKRQLTSEQTTAIIQQSHEQIEELRALFL